MTPECPFSKSSHLKLLREIDTADIIRAYQHAFNIDVTRFFENLSRIQLYECQETKYKFYFPFSIAGDSAFYEHFQQYEWYYMDWKWEHETARKLIKASDKVLEIGCGKGSFVERLTEENIDCTGLELNRDAVTVCKKKGLKIFDELIAQHAESNSGRYDVVCLFQVIEHIADIKRVLQSAVSVLNSGGKLIISVPNDDSFLGLDKYNILNWPPHHMGLWTEYALRKVPNYISVKLTRLYIEPLQPYHYQYFIDVVSANKKKYNKWGWLINYLSDSFLAKLVYNFPLKPKGFTVLGEYIKS